MVGRRGMDHVGAARSRHVATGTVILPASLQPGLHREAATPIGVAFLASLAVIGHALFGRGKLVRVMARDTAKPSFAGAEASALVHLLDLADETC